MTVFLAIYLCHLSLLTLLFIAHALFIFTKGDWLEKAYFKRDFYGAIRNIFLVMTAFDVITFLIIWQLLDYLSNIL